MALHEGKRVLKDGTGKLYKVPVADADQTAKVKGWVDATDADVAQRSSSLAEQAQFGGAAQTAQGVVEKVARTATFNLLPASGDEMRRAAVLDETSPVLSFAAQAAGSALPALATGGLAAGAGLGKVGVAAAEGLAAGAADEAEMAAVQKRELSVGNIVMFGLGGELAGRAVPALLRRGIKGLAPASDAAARVAGEAAEDLAVGEERKALTRAASEAAKMPDGPARTAAMAQTGPATVERAGTELHESMVAAEAVTAKLDKTLDTMADDLVSEAAPAQMTWATQQAQALRDAAALADEVMAPPHSGPPVKPAAGSVEELSEQFREMTGSPPPADVRSQKKARQLLAKARAREKQSGKVVIGDRANVARSLAPDEVAAVDSFATDYRAAGMIEQGASDADIASKLPEYTTESVSALRSQMPKLKKAWQKLSVWNPTSEKPLVKGMSMSDDDIASMVGSGEWTTPNSTYATWDPDVARKFAGRGAGAGRKPVLLVYDGVPTAVPSVGGVKKYDTLAHADKLGEEMIIPRGIAFKARLGKVENGVQTIHLTGSAAGEAGHVNFASARSGPGISDILSSPIGNVSMAAAGGAVGGAIDGRQGMAIGAGAGLGASLLLGRRSGRAMSRLAEDLLTVDGGPKMYKRARAGLRELEQAGAPPEVVKNLRDGLTKKELWGQAADLETELGKVQAKAATARQALPGKDPAAFVETLGKPPTQRGGAEAGLRNAVETIEDMAAMAGKWGLLNKGALGKLVKAAQRARRALGDADASHAGAAAATAATTLKPKKGGSLGGEVVETIADMALGAMGMPPVAGIAAKLMWGKVDDSAKLAIKGAARRLVRPLYDEGLDSAKSVVATSALSRFQGEYSTPQQAFEARSKLLDQVRLQPATIPMALAQSTGTLYKEDPKLFKQLSARVMSQFAYVQANLPVSMGVSMVYPRGIAPSRSQLRDYAETWNSTFKPETVLEDLGNGEASPTQMRILQDVHPDTYEAVKRAVIFEAANAFSEVPTQRKQQLDILFQTDGIAGPCFSWKCSEYIEEANDAAKQRGMAGPSFDSPSAGDMANPAASLNAIRSGVTNRGA